MAVLGRLLVGSSERLDLPDLLSLDSYTAADFKYLLKSFIGGDKPYILNGFDVIQPEDSIGTESVSIRVADSVVYFPASKAGSFYFGLEEGNLNAQPLIPELRKNATNFVYLTLDTFDTAKDSRAFWDPDQNGGEGGEFSQDVNTESVLKVVVGVSVSTFPENTIPICTIKVGPSVIESITDSRDQMFRLGTGGVNPNPFSNYTFRSEPSSGYERSEPPVTMSSALDPNPFKGGDKNIRTLKEWMDVVMTRIKELGGTTYWYEGPAGSGSGPSIINVFGDALGSTLKSKGVWQHDGVVAGQTSWSEDIHYYSLRDPRDIIIRANTITLSSDDSVAWIEMIRDVEINNSTQTVTWQNGSNTVNGITGSFENLAKGDWIKKKPDSPERYLRVEEFYALPNLAGGTTTAALAQSIRLSAVYAGSSGAELGEYTKGEYLLTDINITSRSDASVQAAGGNFFWMAYRSDTTLSLGGAVSTQLTIDITEANGERAKVESTVAHGLVDNDRITITTGPYAGTYVVEVEDTTNFTIQTTITGDSFAQTAFYAIVTTAARSTAYSYSLETANHGFQSNERISIAGTSSSYDGSYLINVRSATTFQIPIGSLITNPGAIAGEIVRLARLNVKTEFGTVKVVQGESVNIGDMDSKNLLTFIGMESLAQTKPNYRVPSGYNALNGYQNYNSAADDDLTIRTSRLTAMMADRVQDRGLQIVGRTNITSVTSGANQMISALADVTLKKPGGSDQTITMTTPIALPANSMIVAYMDRDGSSTITPAVESIGTDLLLAENRLILFYRFAGTTVYDWRGNQLKPAGHINTDLPEDSQNRNVTQWNPGRVVLDPTTGLLDLIVSRAAEVSRVTVLAGASVPQSSYFEFNAALNTTEYYAWYNVDGGGTDPAVVGKTGIQVAISSADSATAVASATIAAINVTAGADVTATSSLAVVTITNDADGQADDTIDGATATTFTFDTVTQGLKPDIEIEIPGSTKNTIDVDAINTLGTLVIADGSSAWVRINRFAAKTFNTVLFTDTPDTNGAGAIYVTPTTDVPVDQDVFVLWTRVEDNLFETHKAQHPDGNVYNEPLTVISGIPSTAYEIQGPVIAGSEIQLSPDSRDTGSGLQEYIVGSGMLEVYLNGQFLLEGEDWSSVGTSGSLSKRITVAQDLEIGDRLVFRIDAAGAVYFASDASGAGSSLQDAYDGGRFISVIVGQPIVITGPSGKLLSIQGDLEVTGVIDPAGITFSQEASDPLAPTDFGFWRNASDELIYKRGAGVALNLSTDLLRKDGSIAMTGALNMGTQKITSLGTPTASTDASTKGYVDTAVSAVAAGALKIDGSNAMLADLDVGANRVVNMADAIDDQDATTKFYVDNQIAAVAAVAGTGLQIDGSNAMLADLNINGNKLINLDDPMAATDGATKAYVDLVGDEALKIDGSNAMLANLDVGGFTLLNVATPMGATDGVNKGYVDDPARYTALYKTLTNNTGSTILAGSIVIASPSVAGEIALADADALATCEGVIGVVLADILDTESGSIQIAGEATILQSGAFTLGKRVYVSGTAGQGTSTAPSAANSVVFLIGIATATNKVILQPQMVHINE